MKPFNFILFAILLLHSQVLKAQVLEKSLKEINQDIWIPFKEAFAGNQAEKFLSLHSKDLTRASGKEIFNFSQYAENQKKSFQNFIQEGIKLEIDFRFLERIANETQASERGIYATTIKTKEGQSNVYYGKFHVILRKEKGIWKILVDYDSNENGTIQADDFKKAFKMDAFDQFK